MNARIEAMTIEEQNRAVEDLLRRKRNQEELEAKMKLGSDLGRRANDRQVGGNHYKTGGEEHWDRQYRLFGPGYFIGCITKYVERYQRKNGYQDLLKAQHFLEKLIEIEGAKPKQVGEPTPEYVNQDR